MIAGDSSTVSDPSGSGSVLIAAFAYYLLGCVLLLSAAPALATLHAFAAFVVLAVVAASNQLVPVLTGAPTASARTVVAFAAPIAAGFGFLVAGFLGARTLGLAAIVLSAGGLAWAGWTVWRLRSARLERGLAAVLGLATLAFAAAAALGGALAGSLDGALPASFVRLAPEHAMLAIVGFASTIVVAISYRFVPMFSLAHVATGKCERLPQWIVPLSALGCAAAFAVFDTRVLAVLGIATALAALWAVRTHLRTLHARMRRRFDVSTLYAAAAWSFGIASALTLALSVRAPGAVAAAVSLAVLGWLSLSIVGYSFKIVGFLAWQTAKRRDPGAQLPALSTALPERSARFSLCALAAGAALVASAPFAGQLGRAGAVLYCAGAFGAASALLRLCAVFGVLGIARRPA